MKSFSNKPKSKDKLIKENQPTKVIKLEKKPNQVLKSEYAKSEIQRPGSCPMSGSGWSPSRNWHKYLSGLRPRSPSPPHRLPAMVLDKPRDELITLKLPPVTFSEAETPPGEKMTSIDDLCDEDKVKIAQLVDELARSKQEKQEAEERITTLKHKVSELKSRLNRQSDKMSDKKSYDELKTLHFNESASLRKQLTELNELLVTMQVQKATTDLQMKTVTVQAEKMTRALHGLHKENTDLHVELRVTKEKLRVAQQAVEAMTKDLQVVQEKINLKTEDKACQSTEDIGCNRIRMRAVDVSEPRPEEHHILTELFFNKDLSSNFAPKETLIFLPSEQTNHSGLYKK